MFWVYVLQNPKGRFYIGHSDDLIARVANHNRIDKTIGNLHARMVLGFWFGLNSTLRVQVRCDASTKSKLGNQPNAFEPSFSGCPVSSVVESRHRRD